MFERIKKKMKNLSILSVIFVIVFFMFSCNSSDNQDDVPTFSDTTISEMNDTSNKTKDFFYSLPSPLIMIKVFKKTGLKYVDGIANSPDKVGAYSSIYSKTLNLGVYSSDLAYAVLNKQTQQATKYLEAIKRLSDDLGMSSLFDTNNYLNRFKNNLNNQDSLVNVVAQLKNEMDIFMQDNDKEKQTLLIFIGAWVENMYIATQLTKEANKEKIAQRIAEQKYILNSLMNVCSNFQTDNEFKSLYVKLNDLKTLFDNLTVQGEDENLMMDDLQLKAITEKTRELRKEIVG